MKKVIKESVEVVLFKDLGNYLNVGIMNRQDEEKYLVSYDINRCDYQFIFIQDGIIHNTSSHSCKTVESLVEKGDEIFVFDSLKESFDWLLA